MEKHECGPEKHECGLEIKPYTLITVIALFATISLTYLSLSGFPPQEYPLLNLSLKVHTTFWERLISLAAMILTFWGLGYSFTYRLEKNEDSLSSSLLNVCIGLGVFPVLSLILNTPLLGIPLDIRVFLPLSLLVPAYSLVKAFTSEGVELKAPKLLFTKDLAYTSIVLFMASLTLYVFVAGSFAYPWLEDGDSWRHADGVKYIAVQKTYVLPEGVPVTETLEPYPPTYDGYMALGHQLNSSLQWSMKYFTSLLASLGIIGFYYFAKKFTGSMDVALASTFFLAATPSYVSHFIWSYTLGYILFFPALYSIEKCVKDRGWIMPAVFQTASLMVIQALIAPTFGVIMVIYLAVRSLMDRKLAKNVLIAGVLGLLISLWIFWIPMYQNYWGSGAKLNSIDVALSKGVFKMDHEATTYPLSEFIFVKPYGNIAIHKGFGLVLFPLFILSTLLMIYLLYAKRLGSPRFIAITLAWAFFAFIGVQSHALPIRFLPGRFWNILTLPISLTAGWGLMELKRMIDAKSPRVYGALMILLVASTVLYTSAYPRYQVQTSVWPMDYFQKYRGHVEGYLALNQLPPDTPVFPFCMDDEKVLGFDKMSYPWDREILEFRGWIHPYYSNKNFNGTLVLDKNPQQIHAFLKSKGYEYAILCPECIEQCLMRENQEECENKYVVFDQKLSQHPGFTPLYKQVDVIYKIS